MDRYLDGELAENRRRHVEEHLRACAACAAEFAARRRLGETLDSTVGTCKAPEGLTPGVMRAVRERAGRDGANAWESARATLAGWIGWLSGPGRRWSFGALGAAGAAFVAFTVYVAAGVDLAPRRQTLLLGQTTLAWNSPAALRVVALRDAEASEPLSGAPVMLQARREAGGPWRTLFAGRTNRLGTVDASFRLPRDLEGRCLLRAQTGAGPLQDRLEKPITIERKTKALLTADKPLYQPGQTVHMRVLAMYAGGAGAAAGQPVTLEVKDPKGTRVYRQEGKTSKWGVAAADFALADQVNQGRYQLVARVGEEETEKTVTVKPYVLPKFRVDLSTAKRYYAPGETVRGSVNASYFFGKPVAGGRVTVTMAAFDTEFHDFATFRGRTDAGGELSFEAALPDRFAGHPLEQGDAMVRMTAAVVDPAGHLEKVVEPLPVSGRPFRLAVVPEGGTPVLGMENIFYVVTSYPDGSVARTHGTVSPANGQPVEFATDASGIAEVRLRVDRMPLRLEIRAVDDRGGEVHDWRDLEKESNWVDPRDRIILRTDRSIYRVGDTVRAEALSWKGSGTIYLDIGRGGQTVLTRSADLEHGRASLAFDLSDDMAGALTLHAYTLSGGWGMGRDTRTILVEPGEQVKLAVQPSSESFRPGEEARLRFAVTDASGKGVAAALGLSIVDESLFALREQDAALEQDYFAMEQAILEPHYQVKAGLPPSTYPSALLRDASAQRRAAVALAVLPKNYRLKDDATSAGFGPSDLRTSYVYRGDPDYALWVDSRPDRQEAAQAFRERYFWGLYWAFLALALVLPTLVFARLAPTMLWVWLPLYGLSLLAFLVGEIRWAPAIVGIYGLITAGLARWRRLGAAEAVLPAVALAVSTLFFPVFAQSREKARLAASAASLKQIASEMRRYTEDYGKSDQAGARPPGPEPPRLRQFFPETLFWQPEVITDEQGRAEVVVPMADSITSWRLSALASTVDGRIGSATRGLRVFQDFFVDLDLPVTLTQHDQVSIPVAVHNYLKTPQTVTVALTQDSWFSLAGEATRTVSLPPNDVGVVQFPLTAKRFGRQSLTVTARGSTISDAIRREIEVLPDGEEEVQTVSDRLAGTATQTVRFPAGAIPGTPRLLLKIHPGVLSQVVEGLDGLLKVPYG
jgi:hypothetical protein